MYLLIPFCTCICTLIICTYSLAGARMLYKNLPKTVGLRRLTLHKSASASAASSNEVTYLLLVECTHFMDHIGEAANLLPILRDAQRSHYVALKLLYVIT